MWKSATRLVYQTLVMILPIVVSIVGAIFFKFIWCNCRIMGFFKGVDDKYLLCSNCKHRMEEPKILPCLHLCCRDCMKELLRKHRESKEFLCPNCQQKCKIPDDGIDGFRTDFQAKCMFRFLQVQEGYQNEKRHDCIGCSHKMEVSSYCFKCEGYLCDECFQFHLANKMLTDHRTRSVALEDETATEMSLERLASLMGIPKCAYHTDKIAEFCCKQCDNLPICPMCITRGQHKNHPVMDVNRLSKLGKKKITKTLEECQKQERNIRKVFENVSGLTERLNDNVKQEERRIDECEDTERQITLSKLQNERAKLTECEGQIKDVEKKKIEEARKAMENEILKMKNIFEKEKQKIKMNSFECLQREQAQFDQREALLVEKVDKTLRDFARQREILHQTKESKEKEIQSKTTLIHNKMERIHSFKESAERVLRANNAWTLVQHLSSIQIAGQTILGELHFDDIDLEGVSNIDIGIGIGGNYHSVSNAQTDTGITDDREHTIDEREGFHVARETLDDQVELPLPEDRSYSELSDEYTSEDHLTTIQNPSKTDSSGESDASDNEIETEKRKQKPQPFDEDSQGNCISGEEMPASDSEDSMSEGYLTQTVKLSNSEESVIKVHGFGNSKQFEINAIAPAGNENVIITGLLSEDSSGVTVVNMTTKVSRTYTFRRSTEGSTWKLFRLCAPMTESEIVTICYRDDIGIFDVNQGKWSVSQRSIGDLVDSWPVGRFVHCVTTDEHNKQVIVGIKNKNKMLVFDYQLNYLKTISLPSNVIAPRDITVHRSNLLVCDRIGGRVYALSMQGNHSELIYEFKKPTLDDMNWKPLSVTKDKNDFIYILWNDNPDERYHCIVTQYSQDRGRLLEVREVDWNSRCLTIADSIRGEKLLVATLKSRKVYLYGLQTQYVHS